MRIAFAGTPESAIAPLAALLASHHFVEFVVTRPDAPTGRGRVMTPSPVASFAAEHDIRVIKTSQLSDYAQEFSQLDAVIVVAFGGMVPKELLNTPSHGWINLHFSLLPTWRGAAPVQYAILSGDEHSGVTAFRIDEGLDTGPVLGQVSTAVDSFETAGELLERLTEYGTTLMLQVLDGLEAGKIFAVPQSAQDASHAPKIAKDDARIVWDHPALAVARRIRAVTPTPGAWTMCNEERIKISPVRLRTDVTDLAPGQVTERAGAVLVGTGTHAVELTMVQRPGKTFVEAGTWVSSTPDGLQFS